MPPHPIEGGTRAQGSEPVHVALLAAALAGCSTPVAGTGTAGTVTPAPTSSEAARGRLRDHRGVAVHRPAGAGAGPAPGPGRGDELALQFEFANNGDRPITPDTLGIDQYQGILMLVDLPRSTAYETLTLRGNDGRISESNGERCLGGAVTVTAVFTAPPAETTELTAMIDGFLPTAVPVQPAGSPTLVDDPMLKARRPGKASRSVEAGALHRGGAGARAARRSGR